MLYKGPEEVPASPAVSIPDEVPRPFLVPAGLTRHEAEQRSQRVADNLKVLRAPLAGIDLVTLDHAALTWIADQDPSIVDAVVSLLARARAARPLDGPTA